MRIGICDDEIKYSKELELYIKEYNSQADWTIDIYKDGNKLLKDGVMKYDLVFLDIEMPTIDGIELANKIVEQNSNIFLIYVTSHFSYVSKAIRNHAFQFLPKPVNKEDLFFELERIVQKLKDREFKLCVQSNSVEYFLNVKDILYAETCNRILVLHMKDGTEYKTVMKMTKLIADTKNYNFVQSHKSYVVNLEYVYSVGADEVQLVGSEYKVPISRGFRDDFKHELNKFMNGITI